MSWTSLPTELQQKILGALAQNGDSLAPYASVSRDWQDVFEKHTFSRLTLTARRLRSFHFATRRRDQVKYIWLCIELPEYDCSECEKYETAKYAEGITIYVKDVMRKALFILSTWKARGSLTLDISVHSPSDSKHWFANSYYGSDAVPTSEVKHCLSNVQNSWHGWIDGQRIAPLPEKSVDRLFVEMIEFEEDFWRGLPNVTAVTSLLLRRQTRRRWTPKNIYKLLGRLPNLQELHYEPWRNWSLLNQQNFDISKFRRHCT